MKRKDIPEYAVWKGMRARCSAPSLKDLSYQQKGIKVCQRWNNFYNFLEDMGKRTIGEKLSIERIDNDKDYEPTNCKWATASEQAKNRGAFNILIEYDGETKVLKDWARHFNIKYTTLYQRMARTNVDLIEAVRLIRLGKKVEYDGKLWTKKELAAHYGVKLPTLTSRLNRSGWTLEEALFGKQ